MSAMIIAAALFLLLVVACGGWTAKFAVSRGRSGAVWFLLGCLFFPFPTIALALIPGR